MFQEEVHITKYDKFWSQNFKAITEYYGLHMSTQQSHQYFQTLILRFSKMHF